MLLYGPTYPLFPIVGGVYYRRVAESVTSVLPAFGQSAEATTAAAKGWLLASALTESTLTASGLTEYDDHWV